MSNKTSSHYLFHLVLVCKKNSPHSCLILETVGLDMYTQLNIGNYNLGYLLELLCYIWNMYRTDLKSIVTSSSLKSFSKKKLYFCVGIITVHGMNKLEPWLLIRALKILYWDIVMIDILGLCDKKKNKVIEKCVNY